MVASGEIGVKVTQIINRVLTICDLYMGCILGNTSILRCEACHGCHHYYFTTIWPL